MERVHESLSERLPPVLEKARKQGRGESVSRSDEREGGRERDEPWEP